MDQPLIYLLLASAITGDGLTESPYERDKNDIYLMAQRLVYSVLRAFSVLLLHPSTSSKVARAVGPRWERAMELSSGLVAGRN